MKKRIICTWIVLFFLTGCGMYALSKSSQPAMQQEEVTVVPESSVPDTIEPIKPLEEESTVTNPAITEISPAETEDDSQNAANESDETAALTWQNTNDSVSPYYYRQLNDSMKKLYDEIYQIILLHDAAVEVSSKDVDNIDLAFNCCMLDHPEIFYVNGYSYTKYTVSNSIKKIELTPTYLYDSAEVMRRKTLIDQEVSKVIQMIPENTSEYEKVKRVYEYVILNTTYDLNAVDNQNICSVFLNHVSVCQGYAKSLQYLLQKLGMEAILVEGTIRSTAERHAWNIVNIDGKYYNVDATWGDASYAADENGNTGSFPEISYDFLNITTEEINETHQLSTPVTVPVCSSLDENYYVMQGAYFTEMNEEQLHQIFDLAYYNGQSYVTLKCASDAVFQTMNEYLITDQKIFEYIQSTSVSYSQNASTLTWTIGL